MVFVRVKLEINSHYITHTRNVAISTVTLILKTKRNTEASVEAIKENQSQLSEQLITRRQREIARERERRREHISHSAGCKPFSVLLHFTYTVLSVFEQNPGASTQHGSVGRCEHSIHTWGRNHIIQAISVSGLHVNSSVVQLQ